VGEGASGKDKDGDESEGVDFLAEDPGSLEWQTLNTRIEAFASEEVLSLYQLWTSTISEYTWAAAKALTHLDNDSPAHDEAQREYEASMKSVHKAEGLLVERVRAELRFDSKRLPRIRIKTGISGVSEMVSVNGKRIDNEG
jgi:hypothetical protein